MKTLAREIAQDIKSNPFGWSPAWSSSGYFTGVEKGDVKITGWGNTAVLSVIHIYIKGKDVEGKWMDNWRIEKAIKAWRGKVTLEHVQAKTA